ncbi:hypothetical protein [Mycolicibacterium setense]
MFYQYLFTIEKFLTLVAENSPAATQVRIEDPEDPDVLDPDIVDFSVYSANEVLEELHQAKSVAAPLKSTISAGEALMILVRMIGKADAPVYVLTTNARPGEDIDRLNALLAGTDSDADVLRELQFIVRHNTIASKALLTVGTGAQLARLRRASVHATGEASSEIRKRTVQTIQKWRSYNGLPLGERAAWILEGRLISDVFERAADTVVEGVGFSSPSHRRVTLSEFTGLLAEPSEVLAQAAARWEAGSGAERVPPGDGVVRTKELGKIVHNFSNIRSRHVLRCTLTGPSGVGKTQTAAMFAHNEANSYDRVCWIKAESETSIVSSITDQHRTIGIPDMAGDDPARIVNAFKERVSSFIGRWLIVFDNAPSSRLLDPFVPTRGNAHILVTSNNEMNWTEYRRARVSDMRPDQARELLRSRLIEDFPESTAEQQNRVRDALDRVAVKLGRRPLALHIAASHFGSTAALVSGVDSYTDKIDTLAELMDVDDYDRGRYPRTFQAAIRLCLERLTEDRSDSVAMTAEAMLNAMSFMASQSVPAYLVFASVTRPQDTLFEGRDPRVGLHQQLPMLNAVIGRIRTQSLVDRRDDPSRDTPWELGIQLDINEIVQYVIRRRMVAATHVLDNTAGHLSAWLADYYQRQQFGFALAIESHVLQLLTLAKDVSGVLMQCPLLAGNEANLRLLQGRPSEARELLHFERALLDRRVSPHFKTLAKTTVQIIEVQIVLGEPIAQIITEIRAATNYVQAVIDEGDLDWDGDQVCANLMTVIENLAFGRSRNDMDRLNELASLRQRVTALLALFPDDRAAMWQARTSAIEHSLSRQDYQGALTDATALLASLEPDQHLQRLDVKGLQIEAVCNLGDVGRLKVEMADFLQDMQRNPQVVKGVWHSLVNTANQLAVWIAFGVQEAPELREVFQTIVRAGGTLCTNDYERYSHALFAGCEASQNGDLHGVKLLLDRAAENRPSDNTIGGHLAIVECWLQYWLQCAEQGHSARAIAVSLQDRQLDMSGGDPILRLVVHAPFLEDLPLAAKNGDNPQLYARHRTDRAGRTRGLEILEVATGRPLAYLIFGEVVQPDSLGQPDRQLAATNLDGRTIRPTCLWLHSTLNPHDDAVRIAIR